MKKTVLFSLLILPWFAACFEDKGNYNYAELDDIKIEGIPAEIEVLGFVENIKLKRQTMRNNARRGDCSYCFHLLRMFYLIVRQGWLGTCVLEYMTSS